MAIRHLADVERAAGAQASDGGRVAGKQELAGDVWGRHAVPTFSKVRPPTHKTDEKLQI